MRDAPTRGRAGLILTCVLVVAACAPMDYRPHARAFARVVEAGAGEAERLDRAGHAAGQDQLLLAVAADPDLALAGEGCEATGGSCELRVEGPPARSFCGTAAACAWPDDQRDPGVGDAARALRAYAAALVRLAGGAKPDGHAGAGPAPLAGAVDLWAGGQRRQALATFVARGRPTVLRLARRLQALTEASAAAVRMTARAHLTFALRRLARSREPGLRLLLARHARDRRLVLRDLAAPLPGAALERIVIAHDLLHRALEEPGPAAAALRDLEVLTTVTPSPDPERQP